MKRNLIEISNWVHSLLETDRQSAKSGVRMKCMHVLPIGSVGSESIKLEYNQFEYVHASS